MKFLRVVNLEKYQHYKERRPPWVKLHRTVFSDYAFSRLQDASKSHLMLIWLLASEYENKLPHDAEWLGRKIDANAPVNIDELVSAGFLEAYDDDSILLAPRVQDESKRGSTENREQSTEKGSAKPKAAPRIPRIAVLASPDVAAVLARYRERHPTRRPGPKEEKATERALGWGYTVPELHEAIDGNAEDPWHAERGKHDLGYLFRDSGHIDNARALFQAGNRLAVNPETGILLAYAGNGR